MENRYLFYAIVIDLIFNKIALLYYKNGPKLCPYSYYMIKFYFPYLNLKLQKKFSYEKQNWIMFYA